MSAPRRRAGLGPPAPPRGRRGKARLSALPFRGRGNAAVPAALPDVLERVASGLRAGAAPLQALADAAGGADLPAALATDLRLVVARAAEWGLEPAISAWARDRPLPSVAAAAAALQVTASVGGPAAPALEGLAGGLRERHDAASEATALAAQARLSAIVVGGAPAVSLGLSLLADQRVAPTLIGTPLGRACLFTGLALQGLAGFWMHRIVRGEA